MPDNWIVDLFSGAGGFSLGAHMAGCKVALSIDVDHDLTSRYRENFPQTPLLLEDIRHLDPRLALQKAARPPSEITAIVGGPPCQGFSEIGRGKVDDPRNLLVTHFFRFVRALEPAFFIFENVPGILREPHRSQLMGELDSLAATYEFIGPLLINAADHGAATNRRRVIIAGSSPAHFSGLEAADFAGRETATTVAEALKLLPGPDVSRLGEDGDYWAPYSGNRPRGRSYSARAMARPPKGLGSEQIRQKYLAGEVSGLQPTRHSPAVLHRFAKTQAGEIDGPSRFPRLEWNQPAPTLRAGTGSDRGSFQAARPIHPSENRVITVREAARLQGFPDWFRFHPTIWHSFRMIGNSVSPYLAKALIDAVLRRRK